MRCLVGRRAGSHLSSYLSVLCGRLVGYLILVNDRSITADGTGDTLGHTYVCERSSIVFEFLQLNSQRKLEV